MSDFDLDLRSIEAHIEEEPEAEPDGPAEPEEADREDVEESEAGRIVLGVLDGTTDGQVWADAVDDGAVLVLSVEGDVNERAAGFAREVAEAGGDLVHFREFLIVTPAGYEIDTDRLR